MWKKESEFQTKLSYNVKSFRNTVVWNTVPKKERKAPKYIQDTSGISETGFEGSTWRKVIKICLLTIFKCTNGEINTRRLSTDWMFSLLLAWLLQHSI